MTTPEYAIDKGYGKQITRVAFYDRNRVAKDTPLSVIELQNALFNKLLKEHPEWEKVGIYRDIDEFGVTPGNRIEFDRLVSDCKKGLIDLVVVKTISMFSRNVVECIDKVSTFRSMDPPVEIYFVNENLDTRNPEKLAPFINMYATMEEAEKRSRNIKGPMKTRYSAGTYNSRGVKHKSHIRRIRRTRGRK